LKTNMISLCLPDTVNEIISECPGFTIARNVSDLLEMAGSNSTNDWREVAYDVPEKGKVIEAMVCRVRNGIAVNYPDPYMRRRDPDCMVIADDLPTDKPRFIDRYGYVFQHLRNATIDWLKTQDLCLFLFSAGVHGKGIGAVVVAPANAGFFALGLALLQGIHDPDQLPESFIPKAVIYVAPPFRHTHFNGKQIVAHHRSESIYEMFSYNLYPGPSAKKGVYGILINLGEQEKWVTAHCSTVQIVTPYDNKITLMHEGASGGGKSEMLEHVHREIDGRLLLGHNLVSGEDRHLVLPRTCDLRPITDDMALCHPSIQKDNGKLCVLDAEDAWFVRVNHITSYGIDPHLEEATIHTPEPLLFLNIDVTPGSTALIWEHIEDSPGVPCPNPRVIMPRAIVSKVINGPVSVDIRSFGVRTPPCTKDSPTYGIIGLMHVLPPALAWLWRLTAPSGHDNPSITKTQGMTSEGVGSYWPFATGRRVDQANLLLRQILETPRVRYILSPNQHIGAWRVGFMPQWIAREYLARRGNAKFYRNQIVPSRCTLLGHAMKTITVEGQTIDPWFLRVESQPEVGEEGYDAGSQILTRFFHEQLKLFMVPDLDPLGKKIIECCLSGGSLGDYSSLIASESLVEDD